MFFASRSCRSTVLNRLGVILCPQTYQKSRVASFSHATELRYAGRPLKSWHTCSLTAWRYMRLAEIAEDDPDVTRRDTSSPGRSHFAVIVSSHSSSKWPQCGHLTPSSRTSRVVEH